MALHITEREKTYAQLVALLEGCAITSEVWKGASGDWIIGSVEEDEADDWTEYVLIGSVEEVLQELQELNA